MKGRQLGDKTAVFSIFQVTFCLGYRSFQGRYLRHIYTRQIVFDFASVNTVNEASSYLDEVQRIELKE